MQRYLVYFIIAQLLCLSVGAQAHAVDAHHSSGEALHVHLDPPLDHDDQDHHAQEQDLSGEQAQSAYQGEPIHDEPIHDEPIHDENGHAHLNIAESVPFDSSIALFVTDTWQAPPTFACLHQAFQPPVPPPDTFSLS